MDTRILLHYLSRGGWAILIYPLYFMYGFTSNAAETDIVPHIITLMGIPLLSTIYHTTRKQQWRRTLNILPVSSKKMAGTVWMMGVGFSLLSLYTGLTAGVIYLMLYEQDKFIQWNRYLSLMACGTLLSTSIFIIEIPYRYSSSPQKMVAYFLKALMGIYPLGILYLWEQSTLVTIVACILAAVQIVATIFVAPYAAMSELKKKSSSSETSMPRIVKQSDITISFIDRLMTQPLTMAMLFGITFSILILGLRESIQTFSDDYKALFTILLFSSCVFLTGWISSYLLVLRSIAVLPVQISKIVIYIISVPFLAFLPIMISALLFNFPFSSYFLAIGVFVSMSAINLRWNPRVALISINVACVLIGFLIGFINSFSHLGWITVFNITGWISVPLLIIVPAIWIYHTLRNTQYPYQTKSVYCDCL
ncbi:hypothetical protein K8I31_22035 [bacterium]|nr:hypothetical protein [bacterium]